MDGAREIVIPEKFEMLFQVLDEYKIINSMFDHAFSSFLQVDSKITSTMVF
jgi:hypothetical protein